MVGSLPKKETVQKMGDKKILILGAGRIGKALEYLLKERELGIVTIIDKVEDAEGLTPGYTDVFAAVPYSAILECAKFAARMKANFYDFTENTEVATKVRSIYLETFGVSNHSELPVAVVNGCGVAPGLCNMIAGDLMSDFGQVKYVDICCGGVPENEKVNPLSYYNIWSLEGLWGLYFGEPTIYKRDGKVTTGKFGDGYRHIHILGKDYEAFYTGGNTVSNLIYNTEIPSVCYGTIRHLGHMLKVADIDKLLNFAKNPKVFYAVIDSLPKDQLDETLIHVEVGGIDHDYNETKRVDQRRIRPLGGLSSMQHATGLGGVFAFMNVHQNNLRGFIKQEDLELCF